MQRLATMLALSLTAAMPAAAQDDAQEESDVVAAAGEAVEAAAAYDEADLDVIDAADADYEANLDAFCVDGADFVECETYIEAPETPYPITGEALAIEGVDYPPASYLAKEEGKVGYQMAIDAQGKATDCSVTQSSGFARLDDATCSILMARNPEFSPAVSPDGEPIAGTFQGSADWVIREPDFGNMSVEVAYVIDAKGGIESCEIIELSGDMPDDLDPAIVCERSPIGTGAVYRNEQGIPVRKRVTVQFRTEVKDVAD